MNWSITYYNQRDRREVMSMPTGIVADHVRLTDAMTVHGADLCMPHAKAMGGGLFKLRPKGLKEQDGCSVTPRWADASWCLHSFVKKTRQTPDAELRLARQRLKDVQHG